MADVVLSTVLERLTAIAEEKIRSQVSLVRDVKKEILELADKLTTIRNVLEDAERRGVQEKSVRGWLKKLEHTAYEMDDILDEWNYYGIDASVKEKVCRSFMPSSRLFFKKIVVRRDTATKIQNVNASLDKILKEKDQFNFAMSTMPTTDYDLRFETTSLIDLEKVQGRDIEKKKNDIVRKLIIDGNSQQILSIVGMGGIGKTTLAQLVCNDNRVKDCFGAPIWICVSDPFDVAEIAREIIDIVGSENPPNTNRLEVILHKLRDCISGKKFLLILDDVWNEDYKKWEPLRINLKYGATSSKILVTTRNVRVAKMMGTFDDEIYIPQQLTDEECWSLLRCISFRGKEERGEFEEVGKKIASKCKGLPLAVNVLGSVLQFKNSVEEWENLLKNEIWELDEAETDLFPHLLLSYKELSPPLKRCFSYCAVYAKDTRIDVDSMIEQWMALGYLGSVTGNPGVELKGRQYFNNLAMRSLFQDFNRSGPNNEIKSCKMHDIVHDFAQSLRMNGRVEVSGLTKRTCQVCNLSLLSRVREYHSLLWKGGCLRFCDCLASLRVLQYNYRLDRCDLEKLIHLRWLDISGSTWFKEDMEIICKLYCLQTLSLKSCSLKEIPHEIGNLVNLRHLNLSENEALEELPDDICNLVELQTLLLNGCSVEEIPRDIGNLVHMRHIDLSGNTRLKVLPESMYNLVELRTLSLKYCSFKEISKEIENLLHLRHLDLSYNKELKELPESISSLSELQTLLLGECSLQEIPHGIGNLVNLTQLDLHRNEELKELPESMRRLVKLQALSIEDCRNCRLPEGLANLSGIQGLDCFFGGSGFNRFGLLKNLNSLKKGLQLFISVNSYSSKELIDDAREGELKKKVHLQKLEFNFIYERDEKEFSSSSFSSSSSSWWMDLIEALEPNQYLRSLTIVRYMGSRLPHWISSPLNLVREIQLWDCNELSAFPPMGKLPLLETLLICGMKELKVVGVEWLGIRGRQGEVRDIQSSSLVAFPKLKELKFWYCYKWLEWEDITAEEEEESSDVSVMPCLTHLTVFNSGLKKLPHRLLRKASSLQLLDITGSLELIQSYGEEDGSPWRSISLNNPQLRIDFT